MKRISNSSWFILGSILLIIGAGAAIAYTQNHSSDKTVVPAKSVQAESGATKPEGLKAGEASPFMALSVGIAQKIVDSTTIENPQPVNQPPAYISDEELSKLFRQNNDVRGYIQFPVLGIASPVMVDTPKNFYLKHDVTKQKNGNGSLYGVGPNTLDLVNNLNSIIFGHNRADRKDFGKLKTLLDSKVNSQPKANEFWVSCIFGEDSIENCRYKIVKVLEVDKHTFFYEDGFSEQNIHVQGYDAEGFIDFLNNATSLIPAFDDKNLTGNDRLVTLSTCHGAAGTSKRLIIVGKMIAIN